MARVEINIKGELVDRLSEDVFSWEEARRRPPAARSEFAPAYDTIARVHGLSIKIFADEHPPPHFHVSYQGQEASFSILDCDRLANVRGLERYEVVIRAWWRANRALLIEKWNLLRPTDCPVGLISLTSS